MRISYRNQSKEHSCVQERVGPGIGRAYWSSFFCPDSSLLISCLYLPLMHRYPCIEPCCFSWVLHWFWDGQTFTKSYFWAESVKVLPTPRVVEPLLKWQLSLCFFHNPKCTEHHCYQQEVYLKNWEYVKQIFCLELKNKFHCCKWCTYSVAVRQRHSVGEGWAVVYPEQPKVLGSWSASVVWSAFSPPVPFGSYRFSRPENDSIHPAWKIKQYSNLEKQKEGSFIIYEIWLKPKLCKKNNNNCGDCLTYTTVSWLIHVPFHLPGIRYKVLHSSVLQSCWIWGREYGLYPVTETQFSTMTFCTVT